MTLPGGHQAASLVFSEFDPYSFPRGTDGSGQVAYLRCYIADLRARSVIEEPAYFDRDYLSEFRTFYSTSARGYSNACRRFHVFALPLDALRSRFDEALGGNEEAHRQLNQEYLGFVIVRPIPATPLGRTVLSWYPENQPQRRRVTNPSRTYTVHVAGLKLSVVGLAWQQQDTAVGACATVALWTMFHSSALDEHHAIPTTAEITEAASARLPLGRRVFPATEGLSLYQICEAIREQGLQPAVLEGDVHAEGHGRLPHRFFSRTRFAASCAAMVRSGYPILIAADVHNASASIGHAVCAVGFRPGPSPVVPPGTAYEEDRDMVHLYLHDDNLGPSVRFALDELALGSAATANASAAVACLRPDSPPARGFRPADIDDPVTGYWTLVPTSIVAALPDEIRMSSDFLLEAAMSLATKLAKQMAAQASAAGVDLPGVTFAAGFFRLKDYLGTELGRRLSGPRLRVARLALVNDVGPMSLHLGVVSIGIGGTPLLDVLYDTTDSEAATGAFAHVVFQRYPVSWLGSLGVHVPAF